MKKLGTPFLLLAVLLLLPVLAAADEPATEGSDLLVELACDPTQSQAGEVEVEPTDPVFMTGCTAEKTCFGGNVVSCTGTTSCSVGCGSVTCDGQQTECTCTAGCGTPAYCACRTCGGARWICLLNWC